MRGDRILQYARNSSNEYTNAQSKEESILESYLAKIEGSVKMENALNKVLSETENVVVKDEYGNKLLIPAGFKIVVEDTNYEGASIKDINVTKGIVIEDVTAGNIKDEETGEISNPTKGSQFVWIPVGNVYYSEAEYRTITLGRYSFSSSETIDSETGKTIPKGTPTLVQPIVGTNTYKDEIAKIYGEYTYTENQPTKSGVSNYGNAIAKNINDFYEKATKNGGYYLGRYEARTTQITERVEGEKPLAQVTCTKTNLIYNWIGQPSASSKCKNMYTSSNFTSDLANSYAWDTAIVFIQTFSGDTDYSMQSSLGSVITGTTTDVVCNIYDMASNREEWSTERFDNMNIYPNSYRGSGTSSGYYFGGAWNGRYMTSFRPILYL